MEEGNSNSNGETVFESLNFNPQLFVNEVLNTVDDLLDDAFSFFLNEAAGMLKTEGTDRSAELSKGVAYIHDLVQTKLLQRMQKWEEYCLRFCFNAPETNMNVVSSGNDLSNLDALTDTEVDTELKSLREQLASLGKESDELARELHKLERESLSSNPHAGSIEESLQFFKKNDNPQMVQELMNAASELREEMGKLKRRKVKDFESKATDMNIGDAVLGAAVEEILQFLDEAH